LRGAQIAGFALFSLLILLAALYYKRAILLITETQIIETYASAYLDTHSQAKMTDCYAVPGQASVRMIVICGPEPFELARHYEYHVGYLGGLIRVYGPGDWSTQDPVAPRYAA